MATKRAVVILNANILDNVIENVTATNIRLKTYYREKLEVLGTLPYLIIP